MPKNENFFINPVKRSFRRIISRPAEESEKEASEEEQDSENQDTSTQTSAEQEPTRQENSARAGKAPPRQGGMRDVFVPWDASGSEGAEGRAGSPASPAGPTDSTASDAAAIANKVIATGTPKPPIEDPDFDTEGDRGQALEEVTSSLADIFEKKVVVNRRVKALLGRYPLVDGRQLADELQEFARSIGAADNSG